MFQNLNIEISKCFIETWIRAAKFNLKIPTHSEDIKQNTDYISTKWNAQGVSKEISDKSEQFALIFHKITKLR